MHSSKLIFFGTGTSQGIPVIGSNHPVCLSNNPKDKRLRSSVYIQKHDKYLLIDCGPDFRQQMLANKKSKLDAVLITHEHNDHVIGLDDLRPIIFKNDQSMKIYAEETVLSSIKERFAYAFGTIKYPGVPSFDIQTIQNHPFVIDDISIIPIRVIHGNLPILGYRIDNMAYITDGSAIPEEELYKLEHLDVLIINALRIHPHSSHFHLNESIEMIRKINPKQAYITHISYELGFHEEVNAQLPNNIQLAYDGLEINF